MNGAGVRQSVTMPVSYTHLDVYKRQVYGSRFPENAEFHESSQLTDHFQTLHHTGRMSGCFYINVAAVAVGHIQYSLYHILPAGIDGYVGPEFLCLCLLYTSRKGHKSCRFQPVGNAVEKAFPFTAHFLAE